MIEVKYENGWHYRVVPSEWVMLPDSKNLLTIEAVRKIKSLHPHLPVDIVSIKKKPLKINIKKCKETCAR